MTDTKLYHLTGPDGKVYDSYEKGTFGGYNNGYTGDYYSEKNRNLYGRLDCPCALRALAAPLYDYDFEGSTILIRWNTAHPFYQKFVAPYNNEKNVASPVDLLVFSLVNSEINTAETDDQRQKLLQFREDMSRVLRTLMA